MCACLLNNVSSNSNENLIFMSNTIDINGICACKNILSEQCWKRTCKESKFPGDEEETFELIKSVNAHGTLTLPSPPSQPLTSIQ
mmetsp:Transcript_20504/g.33507  ORF Transcript_20504/g.33507 Transcript_20504/m.33507 type:complete len:85 (+) Transcript_20504:155-409(+)